MHTHPPRNLLDFVGHAQAGIGAVTFGEVDPPQLLDRLADEVPGLVSVRDFAIGRGIVAAISLRVLPEPSIERDAALRTLLEASDGRALAYGLRAVARLSAARGVSMSPRTVAASTCERVVQAINMHSRDPRLTLSKIARSCGLSRWHVCHLLHQYCKSTFRRELQRARIARACDLMCDPTLSVKETAFGCGYQSASLFARHFRAVRGTSPSTYRQQRQTRNSNAVSRKRG